MAESNRLADYGDVLLAEEVAAVLQVSEWMVYEAAKHRQIPSVKIGQRVRFPRVALEKWLLDGHIVKGE